MTDVHVKMLRTVRTCKILMTEVHVKMLRTVRVCKTLMTEIHVRYSDGGTCKIIRTVRTSKMCILYVRPS
jgi:hypothetical protein